MTKKSIKSKLILLLFIEILLSAGVFVSLYVLQSEGIIKEFIREYMGTQAYTDGFDVIATMIIAAVCLPIILLVGIFVTIKIVKPLVRITAIVDKVSNDDLQDKEELVKLSERKDEIGLIAKSVHNINENLQNNKKNISEYGIELERSNQNFSTEIAKMTEVVDNTNVVMSEVLERCAAQTKEETEAVKQISDINKANRENSLSIEEMTESISKINTFVNDIEEVIAILSKNSSKAAYNIRLVNNQADKTNKLTEKINETLSSVQDMVSHINLLSRSASIEAARAGESGRGFALVSEQIRQIAETATESASEIEGMVRELSDDGQERMEKVQDLSQDTALQTDKINAVKDAIDEVKPNIDLVSKASEKIVVLTADIDKLKDDLTAVLERLSSISRENEMVIEQTIKLNMQSIG